MGRRVKGREPGAADEAEDIRLDKGKKKRRAWDRRGRRSQRAEEEAFSPGAGELEMPWQPIAKR